jgi:DnaJ-class molecular chaperone
MPHPGDPTQHGDLLAAAQIQVPQALTTRERELFEELARLKERK